LIKSFLQAKLVDELMIFVMPGLIGSGIPLSPSIGLDLGLKLNSFEAYDNGVVKMHYYVVSK